MLIFIQCFQSFLVTCISIKICKELIEIYKSIKGVSGIHLMGYKQEKEIASVISSFK